VSPGRVWEEQVRHRCLLLPAVAWDVQLIHQRLLQHQVGGLRTDWVIAMTDANDRLELPTRGPLLVRNS
jgi:hypothetical protein